MHAKNLIVGALVLALVAACEVVPKESTKPKPDPTRFDKPPAPPKHWTDAFETDCLIFADEIVIEGPEGILDHCALRNELEVHQASATTTSEGFRQETTVLPESGIEIHAFIDRWELVAFKKVVIFERVGPVDVHVRASGDVRFIDRTNGKERHEGALSFEGKIRR